MTKKLLLTAALLAGAAGAGVMMADTATSTYATPRAATGWTAIPENNSYVDTYPAKNVGIVIKFDNFDASSATRNTKIEATYTYNDEPISLTIGWSGDNPKIWPGMMGSVPTGTGILHIYLPEGYYYKGTALSPEVDYYLYVGVEPPAPPAPSFEVAMNPKNESKLGEAPTFYYITFDGATSVTNSDDVRPTATWNGTDISSTALGECYENVFSIRFYEMEAREDVITGDGELSIEFPAGYFTVDGQPYNEVITYTVTIDSTAPEFAGFFGLVVDGDPVLNQFLEADRDISWIYTQTSQPLTLNTECTEEVELYCNATKIASIAANATEKEPFVMVAEDMTSFNFSKEEITADGFYSIVVPEGFFKTEDGLELPRSTAYLQKGIGLFTPENGGEVDLLNPDGNIVNSKNAMYAIGIKPYTSASFVLNERRLDDEGNEVISEGCKELAVLSDSEGNTVASFDVNLQFIQQGTLWLKFSNTPITKNGEYKLTLPEGYLLASFGKEQVETPAYELTFTVIGAAEGPEQIYTLTPENKSCEVFPTITMTYEDVKEITLNDPEAKVYLSLSSEANVLAFTVTAENNVVTLTPDDPAYKKYVSAYTVYTVTIPAGFMTLEFNNGETYPNNLVEISDYKINPFVSPTLDPTPGTVANDALNTIVFHLNAPTPGSTIMKAMWLYSVKDGVRGDQMYKYKGTFADKTTNDATLTLTVNESASVHKEATLPDGEYELVILASTYSIKPEGFTTTIPCPEMSFFYTISTSTGVEDLEAADETVTVFTMTGIKVLDNAEKEALSTLPAGLYIVNGKKVVIR